MRARIRHLMAGVTLGAAMLSLTACASGPDTKGLTWINTDLGSVQCLITQAYRGGDMTSCDWSTLTPGKPRADADHYDGHYVQTPRGRVYCLDNSTYGGGDQYDCNWQGR